MHGARHLQTFVHAFTWKFEHALFVWGNAILFVEAQFAALVHSGRRGSEHDWHRSWFSEEDAGSTLAMERDRGLINVIVDEPQGPTNSIPAVWEVKNPTLALVRLHGHTDLEQPGLAADRRSD